MMDRILLRLVVLLVALSSSGCLPSLTGDDTGLSRAAAAVAVIDADEDTYQPALPDSLAKGGDSGSTGGAGRDFTGDNTPSPHDAAPPEPEQKPVGTIRVKVKDNCAPCAKLKKDVANYKGLRFIFEPTTGEAPVLTWQIRNVTNTVVGWIDLPTFIARYNASLKISRAPAVESGAMAPTPLAEVRRVLAILRPQPQEVFVDYGCGDGRWLIEAARTYGCLAVGIEIDPEQAVRARQAAAEAGLSDRVQIVGGDAADAHVEAHVGVAYLYPDALARLKPKLLKLNRFATYMHPVEGVAMQASGDAWVWSRPTVVPRRYAWYGGQAYSGRVCSNPRCAMCAEISRQLGAR